MPESIPRISAMALAGIVVLSVIAPAALGADAASEDLAVTTDEPTAVTETTATIQGNLTALGNASNASLSFEYWVEGDEANASALEVGTLNETSAFDETVGGLAPNTSYVVVARANGSDGQTASGDTVSFTTDDAFDVRTDPAADVANSSATLRGTLTDLGGAENVTVWFEYRQRGEANTTGTIERSLNATGAFQVSVDVLATNTTYVYTAHAEPADGDAEAGDEVTFETVVEPWEDEDRAFGDRVPSLVHKLQELDAQLGTAISVWVVANNPGADNRPEHASPNHDDATEADNSTDDVGDDGERGPPERANDGDDSSEADEDGDAADESETEDGETETEDASDDEEEKADDDGEGGPPDHANNDKAK